MIQRLLALASSVTLLAGAFAVPASAASLGVSVGTGASTSITTSVGGSGSSGTAGVGVGVSGQAGTGATASGSATSGVISNSTMGASAGSSDTLMISSGDQAVVNFTPGADQVSSASAVTSDAQLNAYATQALHADGNIQSVQLGSSMVSMDYKEPGRLFGFIPMHVKAHAVVNSDGTVSVSYPWYHFLVSTDGNVKSAIESRVSSTLASNTGASAGFSVQQRAMLMDDLYAGLSGSARGTASASSTTSSY